MNKNSLSITIPLSGLVFFVIFYFYSMSSLANDSAFITVSSFLFAIFSSFFISYQRSRYDNLRQKLSELDGNISYIYRASTHLGKRLNKEIAKIIKSHYQKIIKSKKWSFHITNRSETLTLIHASLDKNMGGKKVTGLEQTSLNRILAALLAAQISRKEMIFLFGQRMPIVIWTMVYFLAVLLLISLTYFPSYLEFWPSVLKAAFGAAVIHIIVLMHQLNNFMLFESTVGKKSAQDVVNIIDGKS